MKLQLHLLHSLLLLDQLLSLFGHLLYQSIERFSICNSKVQQKG